MRVYNLQTQTLVKKLVTGMQWVSSMAIHPKGDNVILGSYDRRLAWFDLDLSVRPYKTLRYHSLALRSVAFHPTYPLFASASDDTSIHIFHGMVYNDLMQNPLIVPVKVRRTEVCGGLGPRILIGLLYLLGFLFAPRAYLESARLSLKRCRRAWCFGHLLPSKAAMAFQRRC